MHARPPNFRTLDLNLLKVFDVVMEERSVTRAARRLAMSQPAVSNALRRLREATQEELFIPGPAGVTPTAHAAALWPVVRNSLHNLQQILDPQGFDPTREERQFILAMADATAALFAPVLLGSLGAARSRVRLKIVGLASRDPRALLERGEVDLAVGFFPEIAAILRGDGDAGPNGLEPLYTCRYRAVMRRGHPLAAQRELSLDAYCAADHLRVDFTGRPQGFVDEALAGLGRERRVVMSVNEFATAVATLLRSDLVTVMPRSYVAGSGLAPQLACRALPFELPPIEVGMLWHQRHAHDHAGRWLRETVRRAAAGIAEELGAADAAAPGAPAAPGTAIGQPAHSPP